jgi:HSP20 family protein
MRYRRLSIRYTAMGGGRLDWALEELWPGGRLRPLAHIGWRPDIDVYETASAVEIVVDLAGVGEDDFEVQLFEDALVVHGRRQLPPCEGGARYHVVGIRQGPFRAEVPLPVGVDPARVDARYDRGLLSIGLPKGERSR